MRQLDLHGAPEQTGVVAALSGGQHKALSLRLAPERTVFLLHVLLKHSRKRIVPHQVQSQVHFRSHILNRAFLEFAALAKYLFTLRLLRGVLPLIQKGSSHLSGQVLVGRRRVTRRLTAGRLRPEVGSLVALVVRRFGALALVEFASQQGAFFAQLLVLHLQMHQLSLQHLPFLVPNAVVGVPVGLSLDLDSSGGGFGGWWVQISFICRVCVAESVKLLFVFCFFAVEFSLELAESGFVLLEHGSVLGRLQFELLVLHQALPELRLLAGVLLPQST